MGELEMTHEDVIKDIEKAQRRAAKATFIEAKKEFAEEAYPMMATVVEFFGERFERMERALAEIIDQTESFVQPELAEQILQTVELARALADGALRLRVGQQLDLTTLKRLHAIANSLKVAAATTEEQVVAVTVDPGDEDDTEPGDDEGDEEDQIGDPPESDAAAAAPVDVVAEAVEGESTEQKEQR